MSKTSGRPADLATRQTDKLDSGDIDADVIPMRSVPAMRIQTQHVTAQRIAVARDLVAVQQRVEREAMLCGQSFLYSWRQGGGLIEGVSIDGAMILIRNWGNVVTDVQVEEDAPTYWIFRATIIDLETGSTLPRLYRQRKSEKHGAYDDGRATDIAFSIGQSKAIRNAVVKATPEWLIEGAIAAARRGAEAKIESVPKAAEDAIVGFGKFGVTEEMLVKKLGAPRGAWVPKDIVTLKGVYAALRDRLTTVEQEFPREDAPEAAAQKPALPATTEAPKAEPKPAEVPAPTTVKAEEPKTKAPTAKKKDLPVCGAGNDGCVCSRPKDHDGKHFDERTDAEW